MSTHAPALEIINVTRRYRAGVPGCWADVTALDGVSLAVAPGECVGIAGGAGAGKTTLLLCAAAMLPPETGTVRGVRAAFVPAHATTHPYLSVRASLDFTAARRELAGCDEAPDIDGVILRAGLSALAHFRLGQLTAGMRARAALAHALLGEPALLCLDDPLTALDGAERRRYGALLHELRADGIAVLIAARDAGLLEGVGARVIELAAGRITEPSRRARTLELEVGMPRHAAVALSGRIPSVRRRGRALRVPLERVSAEEVLSACRSLGISVYASRVIATRSRVAEGDE
jgi:Cu-processing system ATP-binding protein